MSWVLASLLVVSHLPALTTCSDHVRISYNRSQIGVIDLPNIEPAKLPLHCKSFDLICALEAHGRYNEAFERYEHRYASCGDWGWTLDGHNTNGNDAAVAFKTTPCGTRVAIKGSRTTNTISHIKRECRALQKLDDGSCDGCFPKYYFYSNHTRVCYSGVLVDLTSFGIILRSARLHADTTLVTDLILQGINIIRVLRAHNIEHRDFTFRNMLVGSRRPGGGRYQLKVLDFGASAPVSQPAHTKHGLEVSYGASTTVIRRRHVHLPGNRGQSDLYALCCDFLEHFFKERDQCRLNRLPVPDPYNPHKLHDVLLKVLSENWGEHSDESLGTAEAMIRAVNLF
jgi:hypothetical protein